MSTEFIADGKFMALRAEAQETNTLLREILKELQRTQRAPEAKAASATKLPKEAVGPVTVETVQTVDSGKTDVAPKPAVPRRESPFEQTPPVEGLAGFAQPPKPTDAFTQAVTQKPAGNPQGAKPKG